MKKKTLLVVFYSFLSYSWAQKPITIVENSFKIASSSEVSFFYGFAEDDILLFDFEEQNGKELKEIEIIEYPSSLKYKEYEKSKITQKSIKVSQRGIYQFRFKNSALLTGRVCKVKIQRIATNAQTENFNSMVFTRTIPDPNWVAKQERILVKSDTSVVEITNQVAKVHSKGNLNENKTTFNFKLPTNTIAWSYYIGVDQEGQQAYENATKNLFAHSNSVFNTLVGYSPLVALALGANSYLAQVQGKEDIDFYIVQDKNLTPFLENKPFKYLKKGKVINDFSRIEPIKGELHFCLENDNLLTGVNVTIKIVAIEVKQTWKTKESDLPIPMVEEMYLKN